MNGASDFSLDNRLALCADFVRDGAKVADIGTDHAYLPCGCAVLADATQRLPQTSTPAP